MKIKIVSIFCLILISNFTVAQSNQNASDTLDCIVSDRDTTEFEKLPWFDNNDFLINFLDSLGYPRNGNANRILDENVKYWVPVKFWIYRYSAGVGGPDMKQIQKYIDNLNLYYNQINKTWIGFYLKCNVSFINNSNYLSVSDAEALSLVAVNRDDGAVNIHIADELKNATGTYYNTYLFGDGIFLDSRTYNRNELYASTIAHEVGHFFGLDHTHQYSTRGQCRKEPIDRNRKWPTIRFCPFTPPVSSRTICESNGDGLRDTPADPDLSSNFSCTYILTGKTDPWGDQYQNPPNGSSKPDCSNLMSYNQDRSCRNIFSELQIAVMLYAIERGNKKQCKTHWTSSKGIFDSYEPDNNGENARPIVFNELQERNFHQEYNGNGNWNKCDVDWVNYTAVCSGTYTIETSQIQNRVAADTKLLLYDANLNLLSQNDNISSTNKFSKLSYSFIAGRVYYVKCENLSQNILGYYNLSLGGLKISDNSAGIICAGISYSYTVDNLPDNASVSWSVTPSNLAVLSTAGNTATLRRNSDGQVVLKAIITVPCLAQPQVVTKTIIVGVGNPPSITLKNWDEICGTFGEAYSTKPPFANGYIWTLNNGAVLQNNPGIDGNYFLIQPLQSNPIAGRTYYKYLKVQATNVCGTTGYSVDARLDVGPVPTNCSNGGNCCMLQASPNPVQTNLKISSFYRDKFTSIKIYNDKGQVVKSFDNDLPKNTKMLNIANLEPGLYSVHALFGSKWNSVNIIKF